MIKTKQIDGMKGQFHQQLKFSSRKIIENRNIDIKYSTQIVQYENII